MVKTKQELKQDIEDAERRLTSIQSGQVVIRNKSQRKELEQLGRDEFLRRRAEEQRMNVEGLKKQFEAGEFRETRDRAEEQRQQELIQKNLERLNKKETRTAESQPNFMASPKINQKPSYTPPKNVSGNVYLKDPQGNVIGVMDTKLGQSRAPTAEEKRTQAGAFSSETSVLRSDFSGQKELVQNAQMEKKTNIRNRISREPVTVQRLNETTGEPMGEPFTAPIGREPKNEMIPTQKKQSFLERSREKIENFFDLPLSQKVISPLKNPLKKISESKIEITRIKKSGGRTLILDESGTNLLAVEDKKNKVSRAPTAEESFDFKVTQLKKNPEVQVEFTDAELQFIEKKGLPNEIGFTYDINATATQPIASSQIQFGTLQEEVTPTTARRTIILDPTATQETSDTIVKSFEDAGLITTISLTPDGKRVITGELSATTSEPFLNVFGLQEKPLIAEGTIERPTKITVTKKIDKERIAFTEKSFEENPILKFSSEVSAIFNVGTYGKVLAEGKGLGEAIKETSIEQQMKRQDIALKFSKGGKENINIKILNDLGFNISPIPSAKTQLPIVKGITAEVSESIPALFYGGKLGGKAGAKGLELATKTKAGAKILDPMLVDFGLTATGVAIAGGEVKRLRRISIEEGEAKAVEEALKFGVTGVGFAKGFGAGRVIEPQLAGKSKPVVLEKISFKEDISAKDFDKILPLDSIGTVTRIRAGAVKIEPVKGKQFTEAERMNLETYAEQISGRASFREGTFIVEISKPANEISLSQAQIKNLEKIGFEVKTRKATKAELSEGVKLSEGGLVTDIETGRILKVTPTADFGTVGFRGASATRPIAIPEDIYGNPLTAGVPEFKNVAGGIAIPTGKGLDIRPATTKEIITPYFSEEGVKALKNLYGSRVSQPQIEPFLPESVKFGITDEKAFIKSKMELDRLLKPDKATEEIFTGKTEKSTQTKVKTKPEDSYLSSKDTLDAFNKVFGEKPSSQKVAFEEDIIFETKPPIREGGKPTILIEGAKGRIKKQFDIYKDFGRDVSIGQLTRTDTKSIQEQDIKILQDFETQQTKQDKFLLETFAPQKGKQRTDQDYFYDFSQRTKTPLFPKYEFPEIPPTKFGFPTLPILPFDTPDFRYFDYARRGDGRIPRAPRRLKATPDITSIFFGTKLKKGQKLPRIFTGTEDRPIF